MCTSAILENLNESLKVGFGRCGPNTPNSLNDQKDDIWKWIMIM